MSNLDSPAYFNLDPSQAKQMAAINAANQVRSRASIGGGTSSGSFLGGITHDPTAGHTSFALPNAQGLPQASNPGMNASFLDPAMAHSNPATRNPSQSVSVKQRQTGFLNGLARIMASRNTPLPPALTGVETPTYDPTNTQWKILEPADVGAFRLAGRDVDLFKLWGLVFQNGGGTVLSRDNGWHTILPHFDLPEEYPLPNGSTSVAQMLSQYYMAILLPFEDVYRNNVQNQQRKARQATLQGLPPNTPTRPDGTSPQRAGQPNVPQTPARRLSSASQGSAQNASNESGQVNGLSSDSSALDQEQGIKRKLESEEADNKRARQKTEPLGPDSAAATNGVDSSAAPATAAPPPMNIVRPRQRPSRRKIEYVPLGREIDTVGGRDMKIIEAETIATPLRRPLRDINDWGTVAVDALTMSIRSQLSTELSYALTTFTLLSTMRGDSPTSGFPIVQCGDLLEEVLDLLEERAFDGVEDSSGLDPSEGPPTTHRELVNTLLEIESQPFASLQPRQGTKDPDLGPRQRPGNIVLAVVNILRNLSFIPDNCGFLSQQERLFDLMLRVCSVTTKHGKPAAASPALSLGDLIAVRKDTLHTLMHLAGSLQFSDPPSKTTQKIANRAFQLLASYLVDPTEAVSPFACLQLTGAGGSVKPPFLTDVALETFTRLVQSDVNRKVFSRAIPEASIRLLFSSSVHRLPVSEPDFQLVGRERWLSYLEKTIMTIYSLAFISSPELKKTIKSDRSLGFKGIMLRMVQRFLMNANHELKAQFYISARRAVEAMKVLDDCEDSFDTSETTVTTLAFGMGYGEVGENGTEKGTGLLGGHRDSTWDLLMLRDLDNVIFGELDSLSRVE
ncbi:hypothetical protein DFH07DRAFT_192296 [Mycena maculata]|uniref:ARID domain-containing protein n=1 Tax=Mycena maculata TaxID=230809 RepID=A0AAD7KFD5_9AGAR|nr:hypothetical protein DFH07DRAFT_192296 [Mycena maculata]